MEYLKIDGRSFYNMMANACNKLEKQKEFVNSLNVFPVPDGDTGTNMSMTLRSAVSEMKVKDDATISDMSKQLSKGALMGARGNSGVILSQILRGISIGLQNIREANSHQFANSLMEGCKSAYKAVMRPTEGTILTIVRTAGEEATNSDEKDITELMKDICKQCEDVLNETPNMLPILKKAKVVDAGGMGFLIILRGMYEALDDNIESPLIENKEPIVEDFKHQQDIDPSQIKFGYCTEFFIKSKAADLESFKKDLSYHGDSMIVVGADDIVKVHIHTNDPGLILSKALKLGELSKIKIDNMREQHRRILEAEYPTEKKSDTHEVSGESNSSKKYAFISVASGDGMTQIFQDLGVDYVIEGGQTMNPSTEDILSSINKLNAENIFVLPNNKNIIMAATQAAELSDKNVMVIPTKTIPQGITCLTEFNVEEDSSTNVDIMTKAMDKVLAGAVTYAVRDTEINGKQIKQGDILGLIEGEIKETGNNIYSSCLNIIKQMVGEDSELISIYYGDGCDEAKVIDLVSKLETSYPELDVQYSNGQQPLYYFIVSVE
ncbi:DAK2 domain-containing protein [Clostridium arbusti]|uniref:DAK2 domain-containing protein n=1 Tax=Clostridium arbusti TaxID=1137848 RepID=UPI000287B6FD|nr:DAK2 domain-containing protein [Clostridium arbusti]